MHKQKSKTAILIVALLLGLSFTGVCFAQTGDLSKGSMSVEVVDSSKAYIPNANVTITGPTGEDKQTSDARGTVVFYNLVPGSYSAKVSATGFSTAEVKSVEVGANRRSAVTVPMQVGGVAETITVTGETVQIDPTSTTTGAILTNETYSSMPIARNVSSLFSIAAGAAPAGGGANGLLDGNPSISGSTGLENMYIIDGITTTDPGYGAFGVYNGNYGSLGTGVNTDFVKEVQIKTGGFEAQFGAAMGGIVNIITESGGNDLHGSAYFYAAPGSMEAIYKQPNDYPRIGSPQTETVERNSWDVGFNVGGPFIKNKLFWYGSFNPSVTNRYRQGPVNYATRAMGPQEWNQKSYNWVAKVTFDLAASHRLEGSAFGDPSRWPMQEHREMVRDDLDNQTSAIFGTQNWSVKYHGLLSPKTLVDGSFSWNHSYFEETPQTNTFSLRNYGDPKPTGSYTMEGGAGSIANSSGDSKQWAGMLTQNANVLGVHQIDIGYAYSDVTYDSERFYTGPVWPLPAASGVAAGDVGKPVYGGYFYFYPTRTVAGNPVTNVYYQSRGNFGSPLFATTTTYQNAFLQDAWQINRYITAKLGVRWEQQHIAGQVNNYTFAANWAPRLGFIIDPTGSRKTKLYANWGRFFEKVPQDIATRSMSAEQSYYLEYTTALPPTAANLVPGSKFSPYAVDATVWAAGTKAMYQQEVVAGFERELPMGMVVSARFIWRDVKRILEDIAGITAEQANAGASQQFVLANPSASLDYFHNAVECPDCANGTGYTDDSGMIGADGKPDGFPDARRVYKALEITFDKRMGNNWGVTANYRLAKLFGNYEGLFRNDNTQSDPNITSQFDFAYSPSMGDQFKVGVLPTDRRHVVNIYTNYLYKKINVGVGWTAMTGAPLSKFLAHPAYANAGEIPVGGRGAFGRTPFENYFDLKVEYQLPFKTDKFKVKASVDVFNMFNQKTITQIDQFYELSGYVLNKDFGKPLTYHRPAYARMAFRFEF
jgi:hypothetical protein